MNHRLNTLILAFLLLTASLFAQSNSDEPEKRRPFALSLSAGPTFSKWENAPNDRGELFEYATGAFLGVGLSYRLNRTLGLETGLELTDKIGKDMYDDDYIRLRYLMVPAGFKFHLFRDFITLRVGLFAAIVAGRKGSTGTDRHQEDVPDFDQGFNSEIRFRVVKIRTMNIGLSGACSFGAETVFDDERYSPGGLEYHVTYRNRSFNAGLFISKPVF